MCSHPCDLSGLSQDSSLSRGWGEALKAIFQNRRRASCTPSLEPRGQEGAPRHLPPAAAPGPGPSGKVAARTGPGQAQRPGDARLSRETLGSARPGARGGARRRLQPPGTRATVRPREGRPRARRCTAGRAPDLSVPPRPPPSSRPPLLSSPQPPRDHVGGHRERPHPGPGGDPGVQLQQGQQAPGPHHAVPHRGRGRPVRGGDPGEPGTPPHPPTRPLWPGPSPARGVPLALPRSSIASARTPGARTPRRSHRRIPASRLRAPRLPLQPQPAVAPPGTIQNPHDHPSFSALSCSPRGPGEARYPPSGSGAASLVHSRLAASSFPPLNFSPGL